MTEPTIIQAATAFVSYARREDGDYELTLPRGVRVVGPLAALRGFAEMLAHRIDHALATAPADVAADRSPVGRQPATGWSTAARQLADYRTEGLLPDPEGPLRLLGPGDPELAEVGAHWSALREAEGVARHALRDAVVAAVADGMSEAEAARLAGVDRMTVRSWLGKR